jgi:hypothetical protein
MARGASTNIGPAYALEPITPHDTNLIGPYRGIIVTVAGAVEITDLAGNNRVLASGALAPGDIRWVQFKRIRAAGTTATGLWGVV